MHQENFKRFKKKKKLKEKHTRINTHTHRLLTLSHTELNVQPVSYTIFKDIVLQLFS